MKIFVQQIKYPIFQNVSNCTSFRASINGGLISNDKDIYVSTGVEQDIPTDTYFVRMSSYKKNLPWAIQMNKATKVLSSMMKNNASIKEIINVAEKYIHDINLGKNKIDTSYGVRTTHKGGCFDLLNKSGARGFEYYSRYKNLLSQKWKNGVFIPESMPPYMEANTCKIFKVLHSMGIITGGNSSLNRKSNMELVAKAYNTLKNSDRPTKRDVVKTAAIIQWLIAQEKSYFRGSDSMANILTRALMHSYGLKISPLKSGRSCDFEAFCRNLSDYINIYPYLFEKNPLKD